MAIRLLPGRHQRLILNGNWGLPFFTFTLGLAITIYIGLTLQRHEIHGRISALNTDAKEYSKQLEMVLLNSTLRVQSMLDLYGPANIQIMRQKKVIEQILSNTIFQRISLYKWKSISSDGLPEIKRIFYSRFPGDDFPLPQKNTLMSDQIRAKIAAIKSTSRGHAFTVSHSQLGDTLHLIWRSRSELGSYALFSVPLKEAFSSFTVNPDLSAVLSDEDTGLTLVVNWITKGQVSIVSDPEKVRQRLAESQDLFMATGQINLSSLKLTWIARPDQSINPLTWSIWIAGFLISSLVALLFQFVIDQNKKVAELVVKRTVDLESALDEATEANLAKTRFLANMSHELRTPLNIIIGMIDILNEKTKDPEILGFLKNIRVSGNQLLTLITDLLNVAQGRDSNVSDIVIKSVPIRCPLFFEEIARLVAPDAHKKGLDFCFRLDADVPSYFRGDPARVRQVLMNLLRNSVKYTTEGFIELNVSTVSQADSHKVTLKMAVNDTGIGIPLTRHHQIFDRFVQLQSAKVLSQGGVGLGLSIVKDLVEKMSGRISVDSEVNKGSTFSVEIDFESMTKQTWAEAFHAALSTPLKIAFVCQDPQRVSEVHGFIGGEKIQITHFIRLQDVQFDQYTHVLIESKDGALPLDVPGDASQVQMVWLGDSRHMGKYADLQKLRIVDTYPLLPTPLWAALGVKPPVSKIKKTTQEVLSSDSAALNPPRELNVLIADDDLGNRHLFAAYFADFGWRLTFTENGQEALESYRNSRPDVVVADLRMPIMDGLELTDRVRAFEAAKDLKTVPIILVTADALDETVEAARRHGVTAFLTKPVRKAKIVDVIVSAVRT